MKAPESCLPPQPDSDTYCEPMLGDPVAFTLSDPIPSSDAPPMTFPVFPLPSGLAYSSVQTILASAVSSGWLGGPPVCHGLMTFPGRARLTLIVRRWILGIAH